MSSQPHVLPRLFTITLLLSFAMTGSTFAQQRAVQMQGTVSDQAGSPLPGVSIRVMNTTVGTITDDDGEYVFSFATVQAEAVVEFSFIGFITNRVRVAASGTYDVVLRDDILGLSEVVITGSSVLTERRQLGNSISTVGAAEIGISGATDVTGALSGKITGALISQTSGSPAGSISVKLRGNSTINSDAEPLYIIDGVIVDNSSNEMVLVGSGGVQNRLVDVNPNDIERIEVIKGAAAAAIYGSRASNGVVQIFTKKGVPGAAPRITYNTSVSTSSVRKTLQLNQAPYDWADPTDNANLTKVPVERYDYQDYVFTNGLGSQNYLSVAGGSANTSYFVSGSFLSNEGIVRNSDYNRTTLRVNIGQTLSKWARLDVGTSIARSLSHDVPTGGESFFDGAITSIQFLPGTYDPTPNDLGEYPGLGNDFFGNPYEIVDKYRFSQDVNRLTGNVNLTLTPLQGLSANLIGGYDQYGQTSRGFKGVGTVADADGFTRRGDLTRRLFNLDANVQYVKEVSTGVTSTTSLGATTQSDKTQSIINEASNLGPIVETIDGGTITASSDLISERSLWGTFLQETIGFQDKLFLTVAGRVDGSSVFGANNRDQFYPKVSGAYVLSEESFWQENLNGKIDLFKVRASFGKAGNLTGIGPFERFTNYNPVSFNGQTGLIPSASQGNADIKPETQTEFEIGFDASTLGNRLGIEFTYYNQTVDDLLLSRVLAPSTGASTRIENVGQLTNKGVELLLRGNVYNKDNLKVNLTAQYSANRNKVTSLAGGSSFAVGGFGAQYAIEGQPLGIYYWRAYARDESGALLLTPTGLPQAERGDQALQDATGNGAQRDPVTGQPTGALLRVILGDPNPDWTGSFIADVDYKDFSFRAQFDAVQGFDVTNWNRRNLDRHNYRGGYDYGLELEDGSTITKGTANAKGSGLILEEYLEDGSFIKLREISVAYRLHPNVRGINGLTLSLSGRNLFSIDDYRGYDPEVSISGRQTGVRGFDFGAVPIPRTFTFGATLSL